MATNEINIESSTAGVIVQGSSNNVHIDGDMIVGGSSLQEDDFDLPEPIKIYTGRKKEIKRMESLFFNKNQKKIKNKVVICGIAGIGKSELAVQFANKCQKAGKIKNVYWIIAEHEYEIKKSWKSIKKIYKTSEKSKTLFILDNGINRHKISTCGFKMPDEFFFIITSQLKDWGDDIVQIELSTLDSNSAVEFYKNKLGNVYKDKDRKLLEELANLVGCLPLGLQITAAFVRKYKKLYGENCVQEYVDKLKQSENKIIDAEFPSSSDNPYGKSINTAIKISLEKIEFETGPGKSSFTLDVLYMCSRIDLNIYTVLDCILTNNKKYVGYDINMLNNAFCDLDNLSLLTFQDDNVMMHRFTRKIVRFILKTNREKEFYELCLETIIVNCDQFSSYLMQSILQDIDDTIKSVIMQFFENHNIKILIPEVGNAFRIIFRQLFDYDHDEFIKEIFDTFDHCIEDYINEFHLLKYAELYKKLRLQDNSCYKNMNNSAWKKTKAMEYYKYKVKDVYKDKDRELWEELANLVGCGKSGLLITAAGVLEYEQIHGENCVQEYLEELKHTQNNIDDERFNSKFNKPYDKIYYAAIKISLKRIESNAGPLGNNFTFDILCIDTYLVAYGLETLNWILKKVMNCVNYEINLNKTIDDALKNIGSITSQYGHITMHEMLRYHIRTNYPDNEREFYEKCIEFALLSNTTRPSTLHVVLRNIFKHIDANIELYIMTILDRYKSKIQNESIFNGFNIILSCLVQLGHKEITKKIFDSPGHCAEDYITKFKLVRKAREWGQLDMMKFLQDYLENECKNTNNSQ